MLTSPAEDTQEDHPKDEQFLDLGGRYQRQAGSFWLLQ